MGWDGIVRIIRSQPSESIDDSVWLSPFTDVTNGTRVLVRDRVGTFALVETDAHVCGYIRNAYLVRGKLSFACCP